MFPKCTEPSMHPATNKGELYEHYTEWTYAFNGMAHALFFPIYQNDTYEFPEPINKNLSLSSNHEISNTASLFNEFIYFLVNGCYCFYCTSLQCFDVYSTSAYDTEISSRTDSKMIGWMWRPFHAGNGLLLMDCKLAKWLFHWSKKSES